MAEHIRTSIPRLSQVARFAGRSSSSRTNEGSPMARENSGFRAPSLRSALLVATILATVACGSDSALFAGSDTYVAALTGAREVPAVQTTASGTATFNRIGARITYTVSATGFA